MKTLIVCFSWSGNNRLLANHLKERLGSESVFIEEVRKRKPISILWDLLFKRTPKILEPEVDISQYDHLLLLAPIWDRNIAFPMKSFLLQYGKEIYSYSFVTVCGGRSRQQEHIEKQLRKWLDQAPVQVKQLELTPLIQSKEKGASFEASQYKLEEEDLRFYENDIRQLIEKMDILTLNQVS